MGAEFLGVLCDENGISGDGEYCGDNDAQLDRINVLYHEVPGGKYVTRVVFFEPGVIGAVRASPLAERRRTLSVDQAGHKVEEHHAWYVLLA